MGIVVGLTGENCAGKGTVADYLRKKSFYYLSLSDVLREELAEEGKEITRENLVNKGNELRKQYGPGVLGARTVLKMESDKNYVVDSIRHPDEVKALKKAKGFVLVYITAPAEMRFERMKARKREGDPATLDAFKKLEEKELRNKEASGQQLLDTFAMAQKTIVNDGDTDHLFDSVNSVLGEVSKEFKVNRPSWDEYFMGIAKQVSLRSNCMKRHVAAVIVKDKRIISTGYNGTPRGVTNCDEGGCARCNSYAPSGKDLGECVCSHGEENAIVQAAYHGISVKDGVLYTTFSPCLYCTKMIINAGIKEVVYNEEYPMSELSEKLLKQAGVLLRRVKVKE